MVAGTLLATLSCTNCGAPLPKQARWAAVKCAHCGAVVAPGVAVIARKTFRDALARAERDVPPRPDDLTLAGVRYRAIRWLRAGDHADVLLATRARRLGERVVLKVLRDPASAASVEREWAALDALHASDAQGAPHFTLRLPSPVARGEARLADGTRRPALAVRASPGFRWTLAEVRAEYPEGVDPRHVVWMWRRLLELLGWVHRAGWTHGAVHAEHVLVDEREHGAMLVAWSRAAAVNASPHAAADLTATAKAIRSLLAGGGAPAPLAAVLEPCAAGSPPAADGWALKEIVAQAARRAFGPPAFVPFHMPRPRDAGPADPRRR
jgi:hypothetical protein